MNIFNQNFELLHWVKKISMAFGLDSLNYTRDVINIPPYKLKFLAAELYILAGRSIIVR